jgi:hypothetical protein
LLKPGAEKLAVLFQFDVQTVCEKIWGPGDHLTVVARTTVFHAPTGARLGGGEGLCTTREKKYGKRQQQRTCPTCAAATLFKSKRDPEWFCWAKKGGCGATFPEKDERITGQPVGEVENPELPDTWNTIVKMAKKRALVDGVLLTTGASALFTQDAEDHDPVPEPSAPQQEASQPLAVLPNVVVEKVLAGIKEAKMPTDWLRMQLVALGAEDVPEGPIMRSTILALSEEQADKLLVVCDEVVEAGKKADARKAEK